MQTIAPPCGALTVTAVSAHTPALARTHVRGVLAGRVNARQIEDSVLIASELVTNVVRHVGGPVVLDVDVVDGRIVIRCLDTGKTCTDLPPSGVGADWLEHGRGLFIVGALASSVFEVPVPGGKVIVAFVAVTE